MSEIHDFLSKQRISKALGPQDKYECFIDGPAIGMGSEPVACVLNSVAGQVARVVIADGEDTGVEISVPLSSVAVVGGAKMAEAAKNLFRSK